MYQQDFFDELTVDLFAGAAGAGLGVSAAIGKPIDVAVNHDAVALAVYRANNPYTQTLEADIYDVRPIDATQGRPVGVLWASPDCTHFSVAKGGTPRKQEIRSLAKVIPRWIADVSPRLVFVENVREFMGWGPLDEHGNPIKAQAGESFREWVAEIRALGYSIDWRVLDASRYGAPTKRLRIFVVARRDGAPIRWPDPTHGPGLKPLHTAAECIDWSLPCPSIFERSRPLAPKTEWRIAEGLRRFVFETAQPFIVKVNHGGFDHRTESIDEPLTTVTAKRRGHAIVAPTLIQTGYGERPGQAARVPGLHKPLGTLVDGQKHALVAAWLVKHFGGVVGLPLTQQVGTITAKDHHAIAATTLVKLRGDCHSSPLAAPVPTITAGGMHIAEVRAFLTAYYGSDKTPGKGQSLHTPMRTLTAKARLGLVTVAGDEYQVADIGMRMLQPHELLHAQFGRFAEGYDLSAATTKSAAVRLIGNSVCPEVAEALVSANIAELAEERAA